MSMSNKGLTKLTEECCELGTVAQKAIAFGSLGEHWDGQDLRESLMNEVADVLAACEFVIQQHNLNRKYIALRQDLKLDTFNYWHNGGTEIAIPEDFRQSGNCRTAEKEHQLAGEKGNEML